MRRSLRSAALAGVLAASLLASAGRPALAEDAHSIEARALDLFEKSEAAYESGRFADAIVLLRQSYDLKKEPVLLYNMGRAYEGLGDLAAAAQAYEGFLAASPNTPDRGALERRIATLRRQLAEQAALKKKAQDGDHRAPVRGPSALPWVVAGVGAAGLVAGGVVRILANQRNDDARNEPTYLEAQRLHSQAESFANVSSVCFIAGAVVLVAGVVWGIFDVSASHGRTGASSASTLGSFQF